MTNNFILYVHISPSNKMYFGITCRSVDQRWGRNGCCYAQNKHFHNAIQKYGWDNFLHIVLVNNLSKGWAIQLEKLMILQYETYKFKYGYNRAIGGDYGGSGYRWNQSEDIKRHLSNLKKGVKFSEEHKEALKNGWVRRKISGKGVPWNKGKAMKDTGMLDNFIEAGRKNAENQMRKIYQLDLQDNIVAKYRSVSDAARAIGVNNNTGIFSVANGRQKTAHGFKWKYAECKLTRLGGSGQ